MKTKIREIIEDGLCDFSNPLEINGKEFGMFVDYEDFDKLLDKLEKELLKLMTNAVNRAYKNALRKIKTELKTNNEKSN